MACCLQFANSGEITLCELHSLPPSFRFAHLEDDELMWLISSNVSETSSNAIMNLIGIFCQFNFVTVNCLESACVQCAGSRFVDIYTFTRFSAIS